MKNRISKILALTALSMNYQNTLAATQKPATDELKSELVAAPIQRIFPNSYGSLLLRHYLDKSKEKGATAKLQARYTLGSKFFEDKLDMSLTVGVNNYRTTANNENPTVLKARATHLYAGYSFYAGKFLNDAIEMKATPYMDFMLPQDGYGLNGVVGVATPVSYTRLIPAGKITTSASFDLAMTLGSRPGPKTVAVENPDGTLVAENRLDSDKRNSLGLTLNEDKKTLEAYPTASSIIERREAKVSFSPNNKSLKGAQFYIGAEYEAKLTPKMELNDAGEKVEVKAANNLTGVAYNVKTKTSTRLGVKYEIKENLYISNDYYVKPSEDGVQQYTNVVSVGMNLF